MNALFSAGRPPKWVSGTYQEGVVVWSPSDFQYYMNKTTGARTTDPANDLTNWQPTGDRAVKSVQRGTTATNNNSVTIAAVNIAKCTTYAVGSNSNSAGTITTAVGAVLTNSTTLSFVNTGQTGGGSVAWEITERY